MMTTMIILVMILMSFMFLLMTSFFKNHNIKMNSNHSFECGFNQNTSSLMPFSSQFFLISILFLIFDLEIALFLPFIMTESVKSSNILITMSIMIIMSLGFIKEWKEGMVEWSK